MMKTNAIITFEVELNHSPGADLQHAISDMDYNFTLDEKDVSLGCTEMIVTFIDVDIKE